MAMLSVTEERREQLQSVSEDLLPADRYRDMVEMGTCDGRQCLAMEGETGAQLREALAVN